MGDARKYILEINKIEPSGFTTVERTEVHSLLDAFEGETINGREFSYFEITTSELAGLTVATYERRVSDFLTYVEINSTSEFDRLLDESTFDSVDCT